MRKFAIQGTVLIVGIVAVACGKKDETPPPNTAPTPSASYGAPGAYPPGAPPGAYPTATAPGAYPTATAPGAYPGAPPAAGGMAVPGPMATPCQNDSPCMTHKCNVQYGKCAFPCETDNDCVQGAYCFKGPIATCLPKAPGQP